MAYSREKRAGTSERGISHSSRNEILCGDICARWEVAHGATKIFREIATVGRHPIRQKLARGTHLADWEFLTSTISRHSPRLIYKYSTNVVTFRNASTRHRNAEQKTDATRFRNFRRCGWVSAIRWIGAGKRGAKGRANEFRQLQLRVCINGERWDTLGHVGSRGDSPNSIRNMVITSISIMYR